MSFGVKTKATAILPFRLPVPLMELRGSISVCSLHQGISR